MPERGEYGGVTPEDLEDLHNVDHVSDPAVGQVLAVSSVDNGRPTWGAAVGGSGGGGSSTPGQAAHYIGTWDVAVAYAAGECVRQWDGAEFKLYQAKKATTGDDPTSVVVSWAEVTTPIVMWGSEDPNTTDSVNAHGGGIVAPFNSAYQMVSNGADHLGLLFFTTDISVVQGVGVWDASASALGDFGVSIRSATSTGDENATASTFAVADGAGTADATVTAWSSSGSADARSQAITNTAGATAQTGGRAVDYNGNEAHAYALTAGTDDMRAELSAAVYQGVSPFAVLGEAHVISRATATEGFNDVKGDVIFTDNTEGPVIHDQSDGHTYRIVCTNGVLSTVQVT